MQKKLRIAQIAPLWIPIPPRTYGGIELMLYHLVEELHKRNHKVTLFASGDSNVSVNLSSPINKSIWLEKGIRNPHAAIIKMIHEIKAQAGSFDIIHNHFNFFMFPIALCGDDLPPILTTVHRPVDAFYADAIKTFPQIKFCVLSEDAKQSAEAQGIPVVGVVPNGIDVKLYPFNKKQGDYLLYLGRLNKEKGIIPAIRIAREAGEKIIVAGNIVGTEEWSYFMHEIQPLLNDERVKFAGQVDFKEKIELLRNAKALLFPIDRQEPFGLVMIEAMAAGVPVIAFRRGSVPEVVKDGKTGFVVDTEKEAVAAVKKISSINRADCRKLVEKKFTLGIMVDRYEKLYEKILSSK